MILPDAPNAYDRADQANMRAALKVADAQNIKRGQDYEVGAARVILTDTVTKARYALTVASGSLTVTAL